MSLHHQGTFGPNMSIPGFGRHSGRNRPAFEMYIIMCNEMPDCIGNRMGFTCNKPFESLQVVNVCMEGKQPINWNKINQNHISWKSDFNVNGMNTIVNTIEIKKYSYSRHSYPQYLTIFAAI